MKTSFYSPAEMAGLGLGSYTESTRLSRKASLYNPRDIHLGHEVRIDDFCILSGHVRLGSHIHISAYTALYGAYGIEVDDYATISGRVLIYSQNDDYSGEYLTNPMAGEELTNVTGGKVHIEKYAIIGAGSVVLPDLTIGEGVAVGSLSLVNASLEPWGVYAGVPVKRIKERSRGLLQRIQRQNTPEQ